MTPRNRDRIGTRRRQAAPHPGAANTKPTAKRKTLERARRNRSTFLTLTRFRIARPGRPQTPAAGTLLAGRDRGAISFLWELESGSSGGRSRSLDQRSLSALWASRRNESSEALAARWDEAKTRSR